MAKKAEGRFRTRRGPKRDPEKWAEVEWVEQRAAELGGYGAIKKACREYVERFLLSEDIARFLIDRTIIKSIADLAAFRFRETAAYHEQMADFRRSDAYREKYRKQVADFHKHIKNARDEWHRIEIKIKKARAARN